MVTCIKNHCVEFKFTNGGYMKRIILVMMALTLLIPAMIAENIAILDFSKKDSKAQYVASALMKRDFKNMFKEYDNFELIDQKDVKKEMKSRGFANAMAMGKEDRQATGEALGADVLLWGDVTSVSNSEFKMTVFIMSMKSSDVQMINFNVKRATDQRIETMKQNLIPKLEEAGSGDVDKIRGIAVQNFDTGNYDQALDGFMQLLEIEPNDLEAYGYVAYIYFSQNDYENAITYYKKGLEIAPADRQMLEALAMAYIKNGQPEEAIDTYEVIVENENDKEILVKIARIHAEEEEIDAAQDAYQRAIDIDPDYGVAYNELGVLLFDTDLYDEAIPFLEQAVKAFPDDDGLQKKLAKCYLQTNKLDAAIEQYKSVVAENPDNIKAYFNLAGAYRMKDMNTEALATLESLMKIDAENVRIPLAKADVYIAMNQLSNAKKQVELAMAKDPELYEPYRLMATIKLKQGQVKYDKYNWYVEEYKDKTKYYGEKADKLVRDRDAVQKEAYDLFKESREYLRKALAHTQSNSNKRDIKSVDGLLTQYLDATRPDNF